MEKENILKKITRQTEYLVTKLLYEKELTESQISFLNEYFDGYVNTINKHLNDEEDESLTEKLELYEFAVNEVYNLHDLQDYNEYPALQIAYSKLEDYNRSIENKFAKVRKKELNNSGFTQVILIISTTISIGIALGSILWFLK